MVELTLVARTIKFRQAFKITDVKVGVQPNHKLRIETVVKSFDIGLDSDSECWSWKEALIDAITSARLAENLPANYEKVREEGWRGGGEDFQMMRPSIVASFVPHRHAATVRRRVWPSPPCGMQTPPDASFAKGIFPCLSVATTAGTVASACAGPAHSQRSGWTKLTRTNYRGFALSAPTS